MGLHVPGKCLCCYLFCDHFKVPLVEGKYVIVEVSVGLKEICDGRCLCPKNIYMSSLSKRKSGNMFSLDECS